MAWHGQKAKLEIENATAGMLLKMAVTLQVAFMHRLNRHNPPPHTSPSQVGEYLKKRTGNVQGSVRYEPTTVAEVKKTLSVRVAYGRNAYYGAIWEERGTRKGLLDCLREIKPQLEKIKP